MIKQELLDEIDKLHDKIADRDQTIEDLEKRVEELEQLNSQLRYEIGGDVSGVVITDEQIDAAWKEGEEVYSEHSSFFCALKMLNIVRCEECCCTECWGSTGDHHTHGPLGIDYIDVCETCNGHRWVVKDECPKPHALVDNYGQTRRGR